eukprot:196615_1
MGEVNAFVTELAAQLVDAVKATDDELLQVKLGGNAEEHLLVEVVVVGDEGAGGGTTSNHVEDGGLDLSEVLGVEEMPQVVDDLGSVPEGLGVLAVDDEVQVALAETLLDVLDSGLVIGEHVEADGEQLDLGGQEGELTGLGATSETLDTNDVTTLDAAVDLLVLLLALPVVQGGHDLEGLALALDGQELELGASSALGEDATGDGHDGGAVEVLVILGALLGEVGAELGKGVLHVELVGVGTSLGAELVHEGGTGVVVGLRTLGRGGGLDLLLLLGELA